MWLYEDGLWWCFTNTQEHLSRAQQKYTCKKGKPLMFLSYILAKRLGTGSDINGDETLRLFKLKMFSSGHLKQHLSCKYIAHQEMCFNF